MGVAIKMDLTVFPLIFGAAGSLGDPLGEGKDVLGAEILKRMERMEKTQELENNFQQKTRELENNFQQKTQELENKFQQKTQELEKKIQQKTRELENNFQQKTREMENNFHQLEDQILKERKTDECVGAMTNLGTIEEDVHENIKNIKRLQMKDDEHDKLIEDEMEAQQALLKRMDDVEKKEKNIEDNIVSIEGILDALNEKDGELENDVTKIKGELENDLTKVKGELENDVTKVKGELKQEVTRIDHRLADIQTKTKKLAVCGYRYYWTTYCVITYEKIVS